MAESLEEIEVKKTKGGEKPDDCSKLNFHLCTSNKETTVVSEFLAESSLHGLKYIGQSQRHFVERAFWIVSFIVGVAAAGFLIYEVFNRYEETPVIVSFQSKEQSVDTIPFPAVTFCFNNQFSKDKVDYLKWTYSYLHYSGDRGPKYNETLEKLTKIGNMCESRKSFLDTYLNKNYRDLSPRTDFYYFQNQSQLQQETIDILLEFTPSCQDMIPFVVLDGSPVTRKIQLFKPVITEYGKCCTFNMLPPPLMLKQPLVSDETEGEMFSNPVLGSKSRQLWNQEDIDDWQKWRYSEGFKLSPDTYKSRIELEYAKLSHPFRNQRLGYNFGLSVAINTFEPYCDTVTFRGNTFLLHNPLDIPRVTQFPSVIGANQEVFIKIHPDITFADPDIKDLKVEKRQCLFAKEKKLKYFSPYTQENCFEECKADLIEKECGCSMYYMPQANDTLLCRLDGRTTEGGCIKDTLSLYSTQEMCGYCHPLCEYIDYNFEMTTAMILNWNNSRSWDELTRPWREYYRGDQYRNISIVHFFYGSPSTVPKLRKRLYGVTDLIANTGGILGLCLGFSVLSGAEVLYYVLMRAIWQMFSKRWCNTEVETGTMELKNPSKSNHHGKEKMSKFKCTKAFSISKGKQRRVSFKSKWIYCILIGAAASGYLAYLLLIKDENIVKTKDLFELPLLRNFEDSNVYYADLTFCYVNQFSMEKVLELRRIAESTTDENQRYSAETNLSIIEAMCKYKDALETSSSNKFPPINPDVPNYTFLRNFLEENTISCSQMFPACIYMGMVQENCSQIIESVDTVYGKCCRIRLATTQPKFENSSANITESFGAKLDLISGDDQNNTIDNASLFYKIKFNSSQFVVRGATPSSEFPVDKQPSQFSILLNLNENSYECRNSTTSTNQILFALHSPGKFPKMQEFSSLLEANEEVVITVFPEAVYTNAPDEVMNNEDRKCTPYYWRTQETEMFSTTKAASFDGCSRHFLSSNCKCALFGYHPFSWEPIETSTCQTESNSKDTICLRKMNELLRKRKHICRQFQTQCSGTAYSYTKTNQSMRNAANMWASLIKFGNDTSDAIPWNNNKTGIIHFAFNTSGHTLKSINNWKPFQTSTADAGGRLPMILLMMVLILLCVSFLVLTLLWRCVCSLVVKRTLDFHGALHGCRQEKHEF